MLEEQYISLLIKMAEYYKSAGEYQNASKCLKKGMVYEPLHRELNYWLIELLLLANEHMLAIKYYNIYKNGLEKKLGKKPDADFKKLLQ